MHCSRRCGAPTDVKGGVLSAHDGGIEHGSTLLPGLVSRADGITSSAPLNCGTLHGVPFGAPSAAIGRQATARKRSFVVSSLLPDLLEPLDLSVYVGPLDPRQHPAFCDTDQSSLDLIFRPATGHCAYRELVDRRVRRPVGFAIVSISFGETILIQ
jgi:hypothetical protein